MKFMHTQFGESFTLSPRYGQYSNGRVAITLWDEEGQFAHITVNLPNDHLDPGEMFIKDWSENEQVVAQMIMCGYLEYMQREVQSGFVIAKVARPVGDLLLDMQANSIPGL